MSKKWQKVTELIFFKHISRPTKIREGPPNGHSIDILDSEETNETKKVEDQKVNLDDSVSDWNKLVTSILI